MALLGPWGWEGWTHLWGEGEEIGKKGEGERKGEREIKKEEDFNTEVVRFYKYWYKHIRTYTHNE